jgi:hypothetical protein
MRGDVETEFAEWGISTAATYQRSESNDKYGTAIKR